MMDEKEEAAYELGQRSVWVNLLAHCVRNLGYQSDEAKHAAWIKEREEAIAMLREACRDHGDNDWPENLSLSDIIDKHLVRHL